MVRQGSQALPVHHPRPLAGCGCPRHHVVLCDAYCHLGAVNPIDAVLRWRPGSTHLTVHSEFTPAPKRYRLEHDKSWLLARMRLDLEAGLKVVLVSNSKRFQMDAVTWLCQVGALPGSARPDGPNGERVYVADPEHTGGAVLLYNADNRLDSATDVNAAWPGAMFLSYTPTIKVGVSCHTHHVDRLYCYHIPCDRTASIRDTFQALYRCRDVDPDGYTFCLPQPPVMEGPPCTLAGVEAMFARRRGLLKGTLSLRDMSGGGMSALLGLATAPPPACGDLSVFHDIIATGLAEKGRSIFQYEREFSRCCFNDGFVLAGSRQDRALDDAAKAVKAALKKIKVDPVQIVATMEFNDIATIDWAQARDLEEKETKTAVDYMMLWKYRFLKVVHTKGRADLFDAFYCDVDRKMWFYNLLELSRRVAEASAPKKKITDHLASATTGPHGRDHDTGQVPASGRGRCDRRARADSGCAQAVHDGRH